MDCYAVSGPPLVNVGITDNNGNNACGVGDILMLQYTDQTNLPDLGALGLDALQSVFNLRQAFPFFTQYNVVWTDTYTLTLEVTAVNATLPVPHLAWTVFHQYDFDDPRGVRSLDLLSSPSPAVTLLPAGACGTYCLDVSSRDMLRLI